MDLESIRREYLQGGLNEKDLELNPHKQFEKWIDQAIKSELIDPTAMTLATVNERGQPSQRIVLLKHFDQQGFVFYTNYASRKAQDIEQNSQVSIHFPWHVMERQVKVMGTAERVSATESLKYFLSRPRDSQIAAWASSQSAKISARSVLLAEFERIKEKYKNGKVPLPDFWGGYRVIAETIEFWQGGANRLHDRFEYTKQGEAWDVRRLAP